MNRFLIIEPDRRIRKFYELLVKSDHKNAAVFYASDGKEALEKCKEADYGIILSEVQMPGMGGIDFHKRLKKDLPHLGNRVVFISAGLYGSDFRYIKENGCPYLAIPFAAHAFRKLVCSILALELQTAAMERYSSHKRNFIRTRIKKKAVLQPAEINSANQEVFEGETIDLSDGGIRVTYKGKQLLPGMMLNVFTDALDMIRKQARVVWSANEKGHTDVGMQWV